jgi:NAD(P)-dependent dehydrogenase (short-subunit alcohol dehydrogenase family)
MTSTAQGVLVTGAGDSVGRVIAEAFLRRGDRVHICDIDPERVRATLEANPGMGGTVADIASDADVDRLHEEALEHVAELDVLVNCVGAAGPRAEIEAVSSEDWNAIMDVNVTGFVRCIARLVPDMKARGRGSIVNFSSGSTCTAPPLRTPYVASKAAVEGMTRSLARELGPYGVRCNAILPGAIENGRLRAIVERNAEAHGVSPEDYRQELVRYISLRRTIEMDEFADLVLFLCSAGGRGITGQLLRLDGNVEWEDS